MSDVSFDSLDKNTIPTETPIIFLHGKKDVSIPMQHIENVVEFGSKHLVKLIKLDGNHSLSSLTQNKAIDQYIADLYFMKRNIKSLILKSKEEVKKKKKVHKGISRLNLLDAIRKRKK